MPPIPVESITQNERLAAAVERAMRQPFVALDIESDNFFRYPERICFIQMALPDRVYLIDPLAVDDMAPLGRLLADERVEKVFHSSDFDVRSLDREWGFRINNLFDSSIAAAFVGMPRLGLGTVLEEQLGVTIPKNKRLQRSDWGRRPLSPEALDYAAADVLHLLPLRQLLTQKLHALGRAAWVAEESARMTAIRYVPPNREAAFLSLKGSRNLDGRGLARLAAVVAFREREALRQARPPFRVLGDAVLVQLATQPDTELVGMPGVGRYGRPPLVARLRQALAAGARAPAVKRPRPAMPSRPRPTPEEEKLLKRLKEWRLTQGTRLGLDQALLWPLPSLERLSRAPRSLDAELEAPEVRRWQRQELGPLLRSILAADST